METNQIIERIIASKKAVITLSHERETTDYRGDFDDQSAIDWIKKELSRGNTWAWCQVEVKVEFCGFEATDYLGGCSYKNKTDFKEGGYYQDMVTTCLDSIAKEVSTLLTTLSI